ncbi:hypothetical protein LTR53_009178 [Teratosphaeriaceae sp. CCFEE 6253]|nr:hypothetical protein LTR53_009178 [Teratosphaeriaceae sp. CCFEE 6253]
MVTPTVSCPSGGSFYACASGSRYVGCCLTNPCDTGCFAGQLVPASFEASQWGQFPDQQCDSGAFYTCIYASQGNTTFLGCCASNACSAGSCSGDALAGAYLSNNPQEAAPFLSLNSSWLATATVSASLASATLATSTASIESGTSLYSLLMSASSGGSSPLASPASTVDSASTIVSASTTATSAPILPHSTTNVGAIAGGAVGGFAVLAALVVALVWLLRRKKTHPSPPSAAQPEAVAEKYDAGPALNTTDPYNKHASRSALSSPRPPYSPCPPSYVSDVDRRHMSYELPGETQWEMDSGQRFHAYRPDRGLGIHEAA